MRGPMPTLRGWVVGCCGVLALLAAAWSGRNDLLFVGLLLTIAPLAALVGVALERPALTVDRLYSPESVTVGDSTQVRLEVRNRARRAVPPLTWTDHLPPEVIGAGRRALPSLARAGRAHSSATLHYTARATRRGAYALGPLRLRRTDPFGLARGGFAVGDVRVLLVAPRVSPLGRTNPGDTRGDGVEQELVRQAVPNADEVVVRDYRPGDPMARVNWRATARQDRLMVRQEEQRSNPQAWLLLDTVRSAVAQRATDRAPFERAVSLVASIGSHLLGLGYSLGVLETGRRPQLSGSYELPDGGHRLIAELAAIDQTHDAGDDRGGQLVAALRRTGSTSPVFLVLADGDEHTWSQLAMLRHHAEPAVAFLTAATARVARPALEAAGWVCVDVDETRDASAAWDAALNESRRHV